ncbi:MAG: GGDEF domain-containing protein, partial [Pseudomonadota bacterium]
RAIEENRDTDEKAGFFLMLDADNFKQVNDTYGHAVGDTVLLKITDVIRSALRDGDIVGRLGGEEFGIYLRGVNRQQAFEVSERIRLQVAETPITVGDDEIYNATVSIGAVFAAKQHNVTQLMQMADRNLYRAKGKGRNQVVFDAFLSKEGTYRTRPLSA